MESAPKYCTGEPICVGDTVRIGADGAWVGIVESVITKESPEWTDYMEGVMITGPEFGRLLNAFGALAK